MDVGMSFSCWIVASAVNFLAIDYYRAKPLGMQTLMDPLRIEFVSFVSVVQTIGCLDTLLPRPLPTLPALVIAILLHAFILAVLLQLTVIPVAKYLHIYRQHWIADIGWSDETIVFWIRFSTVVIVTAAEIYTVTSQHYLDFFEYEYLSGETNPDFPSVTPVFTIVFIGPAIVFNVVLALIVAYENAKDNSIVPEDAKTKAMKTVATFACLTAVAVVMSGFMNRFGHGLDLEARRLVGLFAVCVIIPVLFVGSNANIRNRAVKKFLCFAFLNRNNRVGLIRVC